MYKLLKKIVSYFRTVNIYEINENTSYNISKKYKLKIYKNFSSIKLKNIINYFTIYKEKKKRFT